MSHVIRRKASDDKHELRAPRALERLDATTGTSRPLRDPHITLVHPSRPQSHYALLYCAVLYCTVHFLCSEPIRSDPSLSHLFSLCLIMSLTRSDRLHCAYCIVRYVHSSIQYCTSIHSSHSDADEIPVRKMR